MRSRTRRLDGRGGNRGQTVHAVRITTGELLRRGYRFVTVDELFGVPASQQEPSAG